MTPLQAMRGGFMLGIWISLTILSASEYYDITVDETYKLFKNDCEIKLIEERNSALHKFMKEHHIYSKWFGKWMMNKYQRRDEELGKLSNNIIDDVL
ncbi:unnamed protein product [Thelazia callipaeda]|uniref:Inhibitor_I29 domain-containing protein n=1 Tax=Thelazia callipaeda TaxID=103827 RepID=A0A0N5CRC1_THECL|nr:unnamed protein product [Thelazia callipaeda]